MTPFKSSKGGHGVMEDGNPPSTNLWVGNLSQDATDSDLMDLFGNYGALDSVTTYSSRNFAFVYFKRVEDACSAKIGLHGHVFRGSPLKIEFARPAKPCKSLWVGSIGQSVSKDELEEEFSKFGKVEDLRYFKDRNCALVEFVKIDDALLAMRSLNGKRLGGDMIRVDFLRSQPSRRDPLSDLRDVRDGQLFDAQPGARRAQHPASGGRREGQPSNILWIGYPPSLQIDEQMLHNAMILFGEIERIKSFPTRHYSFVEFRSIDEARRAKEGLQGRLFNDPRISIMYSSSELGPGKELPSSFYTKPPKSDIITEQTYVSNHVDHYDRHVGLNSSGRIISGILPSPGARIKQSVRSGWDVTDGPLFIRAPKRSRMDPSFPADEDSFSPRNYDQTSVLMKNNVSPVGIRGAAANPHIDNDFIWRGTIAKGGTPVCHARCVPVGNGIDSDLPEVVNCSARTGLDMLAKHYAEAIGFDIVFFLPDSEEDFASYTEFLRYLGSKNRAGVAKFDDGTTLFLVPPSEFLTNVLKVKGPERLYGVVLKLPPPIPVTNPAPYQLRAADDDGYNAMLPEETTKHLTKPYFHSSSDSVMASSALQDYPNNNAGVSLTPELIATLTSILPTTSESGGWKTDAQVSTNTQIPIYPSVSGSVPYGLAQIQDSGAGGRPMANFLAPAQNGQFPTSSVVAPHYPVDVPHPQKAHVGNDVNSSYTPPVSFPGQFHASNYIQPPEKGFQNASVAPQDPEVDKNQRYQSTLQFAASLLLGIQQQQQSVPPSGGS